MQTLKLAKEKRKGREYETSWPPPENYLMPNEREVVLLYAGEQILAELRERYWN